MHALAPMLKQRDRFTPADLQEMSRKAASGFPLGSLEIVRGDAPRFARGHLPFPRVPMRHDYLIC
jgi:hypothetical protein